MSEQQALTTTGAGALIEQVVVMGDLSKLTPEQRTTYYKQVCISLRLNPLTRPFSYIVLNGKLTLYANKDCTEQLRKLNDVSIVKLERESTDGIYVVTAYAQDKAGRADSSIGAVTIETLKGDARANAMMKAETKAKRRVTLSICGLGMLDETEIETIPDARALPSESIESGKAEPEHTSTKPGLADIVKQAQQLIDNPPKQWTQATLDAIRNNWQALRESAATDEIDIAELPQGTRISGYLQAILVEGTKLQAHREAVAASEAQPA